MFGNRKAKSARHQLAKELWYHPAVTGVRLVVEKGRGEVLEVDITHELRRDEPQIPHVFEALPVVLKTMSKRPIVAAQIDD